MANKEPIPEKPEIRIEENDDVTTHGFTPTEDREDTEPQVEEGDGDD